MKKKGLVTSYAVAKKGLRVAKKKAVRKLRGVANPQKTLPEDNYDDGPSMLGLVVISDEEEVITLYPISISIYKPIYLFLCCCLLTLPFQIRIYVYINI